MDFLHYLEALEANSSNESTPDDGGSGEGTSISIDGLYVALVQCFGITICGYLAGRLKIISSHETVGLNTFVSTFSLPALIFLSLSRLKWDTVNWTFLLAILVSKSIIFFSVAIVTLFIAKPLHWGKAGVLAMFCTQTNDFAIGYPIVVALYSKTHPDYAQYMYLLAPISLAILNPIGYVLCEVAKFKERSTERRNLPICTEPDARRNRWLPERARALLKTAREIFFNPILFMTMLGVIGGFIFPNGLPDVVAGVLEVLGQSFSATSLFLLGLKIVGNGGQMKGSGFLIPGVLIIVKLLAYPIIARQTVNIMNAGTNFSDTTELSTFAFLYGTFPPAPGVFVVATQYGVFAEMIASSLVACTFISAPLMFMSAKVISLTNLKPKDYIGELDTFSLDISIAGICACIWVLVVFILTNRIRLMPHKITACLVISQMLTCVGVIMWSNIEHGPRWESYLQFFLLNVGSYSSRLWTAFLAISLLFLQCRSLCFVLKIWPYMIGVAWGVPSILSAILIVADGKNFSTEKRNPAFQYGNAQAAITVFLLVMCFIVTAGCLLLHERYKKRLEKYMNLSREVSNPDAEFREAFSAASTANLLHNSESNLNIRRRNNSISSSDDDDIARTGNACDTQNGNCCQDQNNTLKVPNVLDIEDLGSKATSIAPSSEFSALRHMCNASYTCSGTSRADCQNMIEKYEETNRQGLEPLERGDDADEYQSLKHTVLLILLICSMFVGLSLSIWTLIMDGLSGIYLELSFLDIFLNFGQGLIVFAVFIGDTGELLQPVMKYWRKIWYGAYTIVVPSWDELNLETQQICEQFRTHHLDHCKKSIAKDRRWRIKVYRKVFYGNKFVDWLIEVGLARDRMLAVHYARHLVDGRVLRHINNVYHFQDKNLLYTFCNRA